MRFPALRTLIWSNYAAAVVVIAATVKALVDSEGVPFVGREGLLLVAVVVVLWFVTIAELIRLALAVEQNTRDTAERAIVTPR